jgi:hypothetical protein
LNVTLDEVDRQMENLGKPVTETLTHVGGVADAADRTVARLAAAVGSIEDVAGSVAHTAELAKQAVSPAIVNVGAALSGVSAGLRRLLTRSDDQET